MWVITPRIYNRAYRLAPCHRQGATIWGDLGGRFLEKDVPPVFYLSFFLIFSCTRSFRLRRQLDTQKSLRLKEGVVPHLTTEQIFKLCPQSKVRIRAVLAINPNQRVR